MKRTLAGVVLASAIAFIAGGCATKQAATNCGVCANVPPATSVAVNPATADALRAALLDERRVQAYYENVMARNGRVRPFVNIAGAEVCHEQMVTNLMKRHDVAVPEGPVTNVPAVPSTFAECNQLAAQLERENVAMYDRLLTEVKEPDIRALFTNLRAASLNNHLPAFERWSTPGAAPASAGMMSPGYGYGRQAGRCGGPGPGCANACTAPCQAPCTLSK